ncbi:hypothetical protein CDCA_CDCA02G0725 [Cyanidium caldarium]|uniref:Ribosomal RNA-processing protein 8 n=1 Tax=Cyanidium caldarium TaxID=2771 RepID=A0AAV9IRI5_CYACA|nr:hypothetical protein CDCA_CDCA02G0725 [Cyanidium caldarium]
MTRRRHRTGGSGERQLSNQRPRATGAATIRKTMNAPCAQNLTPETPSLFASQSTLPARGTRGLTPLQLRLQQRLQSASFRALNEQLYGSTSEASKQLFDRQPELFQEYHRGYREQMAGWPVKPVEECVRYLRQRITERLRLLRRRQVQRDRTGSRMHAASREEFIIVDMGCGDAHIAAQLDSRFTPSAASSDAAGHLRVQVHSYDLVAGNTRVTACDVARGVPLPSQVADAVVFCLSLMPSNYEALLNEGIRLLRRTETSDDTHRGTASTARMLVIEVASRFQDADTPTTNASPVSRTERAFVQGLASRGLRLLHRRDLQRFFLLFEFALAEETTEAVAEYSSRVPMPPLKPCAYKRR